ncbi:alpha/beta hydrolase [Chondromyces apiculatus]|uniref:BD-FAE-like domain-containing protein n=1 Tax=Chondromyces apiculatus DSM 436 TaxID=1192034 RepID=A0A017TFC9_9BACT|nr:alpha/beta hydrolase fold domain-containing protein [Chondromyces apiculatus]EYF07602.1 Hypothetical protein CAP_8103 [Chondromyces apiculatus DSM 436]
MTSFSRSVALALVLGVGPLYACGGSDSGGGGGEAGSTGTQQPSAGGAGGTGGTGGSGGTGGTGGSGGTGGTGGSTAEPDVPPELAFSDPPVANLADGVRFAEAVPYGPDPAQVMDVFLPESGTPTAAVFFFHGGGFTGGSRTTAYSGSASALRQVTDAGVAWIGVDYRLLQDPGVETEGVIKSLRDCQRSLQFVRRWADVFNLDPERVGVYGGSAGAGTSLWLAFHDDMAIPGGGDMVARASTRPLAAAANSTQSTYDVMRWAPDVFADSYAYVTNDLLLSQAQLRAMIVRFYGLDGALVNDADGIAAALETPEMVAYRADVDMLALMSSDDPGAYIQNTGPNSAPTDASFDLLHHPLHAMALRDRAAAVGAELEADIPAYNIDSSTSAMGFLLDRLVP